MMIIDWKRYICLVTVFAGVFFAAQRTYLPMSANVLEFRGGNGCDSPIGGDPICAPKPGQTCTVHMGQRCDPDTNREGFCDYCDPVWDSCHPCRVDLINCKDQHADSCCYD